MTERIWNFAPSNHTISAGSSSDGSDQFSNYSLNNLAREIIQNSLDARQDNKSVKVEFHLFSTTCSEVPGLQDLVKYVSRLYNQKSKGDHSDSEYVIAKNILNYLNNANKTNKVCWLRISDSNTTGLWGSSVPANKDTAWFAFINGSGKNKKGEKSGGSKGQGKGAIFVNSILRTMFVSTYAYREDVGHDELANIGVAKLPSILLDDEDKINPDYTFGVGYCVDNNEEAIKYNSASEGLLEIDPEFDRMQLGYGTDIYIPFFAYEDNWNDIMELEAIMSFFPAIINGELRLVFSFDDTTVKHEIDASTVSQYILGKGKNKKEARAIYDCLTSTNTKKIQYNDKKGYEMNLWLLQDNLEGVNNVYLYRLPTKMKIKAEPKESSVGYTGVLFIEGDEICKRLRSVEDATHQNWYISKYKDTPYTKDEIQNAITLVDKFLSNECQKFGTTGTQESIYFEVKGWDTEEDVDNMDIDQTKEYGLPTDDIVFDLKRDDEKNPRRKRLKRKGNVIKDDSDVEGYVEDIGKTGEGEEEYSHPDGHNQGNGGEIHPGQATDNYNPNEGENLVIGRRKIATSNARMPSVNPKEGVFDLLFKPEKTGTDVNIEILKSGIDGDSEKTSILSAKLNGKPLKIKNNKILMDKINKGTEYRINLVLAENQNYIWEVNIDAEE